MPVHNPNPAYGAHLGAFAGIPSFMRQPVSREIKDIDIAVVGVPFDSGANSFRSGTRLGPRHIRAASLLIWGHHANFDISPLEELSLVDYGDIEVEQTSIDDTMRIIEAEVASILSQGPTVLALGGDHSISLPLLRAHAGRFGPLAVAHFDSHPDTSHGRHDHGTPFRYAIQEGLVDPTAYIQIGIRGPTYPGDLQDARALGLTMLTIDDCFQMGTAAIIDKIQAMMDERPVYVSLDIDSLDPAYAPGTGTPEVGGFTSYQMLQLVRGLRGLNLVGMDLVEVSPPFDHGEITSILAANLSFEFITLLALQKVTTRVEN